MTSQTTRRAIIAGFAAAPLSAHAAPASLSPALVEAIHLHKAARAALDACQGPEDVLEHLNRVDDAAALAVALAPTASDAELLEKLRYLCAYEQGLWGEPVANLEFGLLAIAVELYFKAGA